MSIHPRATPSAAGPIFKEVGCGVVVVLCWLSSLAGPVDFLIFSFVSVFFEMCGGTLVSGC